MTDKTNGNTQPSGCTLILIASTIIVIVIGLVIIANYLSTLAGIH